MFWRPKKQSLPRLRVHKPRLCDAFLAIVLLVTSCGGRNFDVMTEASADLSAGADLSGATFSDFAPIKLFDNQTMKLQAGGTRDRVTSVKPRYVALSIVVDNQDSLQDLSFLSDVSVSIQYGALPAKAMATQSTFAPGTNAVAFNVANVELLPYFRQGDPQIAITGTGQAPDSLTVRAEVVWEIDLSSGAILVQ